MNAEGKAGLDIISGLMMSRAEYRMRVRIGCHFAEK